MTCGQTLIKLREGKGLTRHQFADAIGIPYTTLRNYETDEREPGHKFLIAAAGVLGVTVDTLLGVDAKRTKEAQLAPPPGLMPVSQNRIPILGPVAAGEPIYAERDYESYVSVCDDANKADAALRVVGDSMTPRFLDGDLVFIRLQDDVDDGQIAAVCVDDSVTLKHVYHIRGGLSLISENPNYQPMIFTEENSFALHILGLAIGYLRWYK